MNTRNFLDANVWLALVWGRHVHSEIARRWFEQASDEQFFFCRFTQLTILRLLTTEKIMGKDTATMSGGWRLWDKVQADSRIAILAEPSGLERELRSYTQLSSRSRKVWADAYLLSFASALDLKLVTFDRALRSRSVEVVVLGANS